MDEASEQLLLKISKEQNLDARCREKIIEFTHGRHILHNAFRNVLIAHGHAKTNPNNQNAGSRRSDGNGIVA